MQYLIIEILHSLVAVKAGSNFPGKRFIISDIEVGIIVTHCICTTINELQIQHKKLVGVTINSVTAKI